MSIVPNSTELDPQFGQFQWIGEIEHRHELWGQPGKIAVTGFLSRGRMGSYADAIELAQLTGGPADIAAVRQYQRRGRAACATPLVCDVGSDLAKPADQASTDLFAMIFDSTTKGILCFRRHANGRMLCEWKELILILVARSTVRHPSSR